MLKITGEGSSFWTYKIKAGLIVVFMSLNRRSRQLIIKVSWTAVYRIQFPCCICPFRYIHFSLDQQELPYAYPFAQSCMSWVWLMDLQHTLSILIGKIIQETMIPITESGEEKICERWLTSCLVANGFEERDKVKGNHKSIT